MNQRPTNNERNEETMNNQNYDRKYAVYIPECCAPRELVLEIRELSDEELTTETEVGEPIPCPTVEYIEKAVGGWFQAVRLALPEPETAGPIRDYWGWVNEEGQRLEMSPNLLASILYGGVILGPMIITGDDGFGDAPALTMAEIVDLRDSILGPLQRLANRGFIGGAYTLKLCAPWRENDPIIYNITATKRTASKGE